jgi:hypothetical protein
MLNGQAALVTTYSMMSDPWQLTLSLGCMKTCAIEYGHHKRIKIVPDGYRGFW